HRCSLCYNPGNCVERLIKQRRGRRRSSRVLSHGCGRPRLGFVLLVVLVPYAAPHVHAIQQPCGVARGWPTISLDTGAQQRMPTIDLHQRSAVVTGAAKGIGRAIAARLLTAGAAVCLWDRAPEALTSTAHDLRTLGT